MWCSKAYEDEQYQDSSKKGSNVPVKRKRPDPNEAKLDEVKGIVSKLREQLGSEYTSEQYHVWVQLIHIGKHSSYSDPPDFPFLFSKNKKKTKCAVELEALLPAPLRGLPPWDVLQENACQCIQNTSLNWKSGTLS